MLLSLAVTARNGVVVAPDRPAEPPTAPIDQRSLALEHVGARGGPSLRASSNAVRRQKVQSLRSSLAQRRERGAGSRRLSLLLSYGMYDSAMSHRINARLDDELARKVDELCKLTGQSASAIIKVALEAYYERTRAAGMSPRAVLERSGFIGCAEGDSNLSTDYKRLLETSMRSKA